MMSKIQVVFGFAVLATGDSRCAESYSEDCSQSRCCGAPGFKCFRKNEGWAACKPSCSHVDAYDDNSQWSCDVLVPELVPDRDLKMCSSSYDENCQTTGCCAEPGMQCFAKDSSWATCKPACTPGIDANDLAGFRTTWSCKILTSPLETTRSHDSALRTLTDVAKELPAGPEFLERRDEPSSSFVRTPSNWNSQPESSNQLFLRQRRVAGSKTLVTAGQRIKVGLKLYWPQMVCGIALFFSAMVFGAVAFLWCQTLRRSSTTGQALEAAERAHFLEA